MNEAANLERPGSAESPLRSPWMTDPQTELDQDRQSSPPRYYEELFCTSQTTNALVPLADALRTSTGPQSDVVKQSYLGKLERNHRRYFVLRAGSHTGPSRLEWYKNQEKFRAMEKSAGKAVLFGPSKQGVIYLRCCLGVSRSGSSKKGHAVALYAQDQTMVLVVDDQREQEEWYLAIKKLMEEERRDEEYGEGFDEDDDGYCTLPPAAFFKEVWPVRVKPRGLGCSRSLAGESRLCLTATSLILIRVAACSDLPSVTMPLLSVRRFGHLDGSFFLELGRSAPNGPGEIWMEAREPGNPAVAQHIHEVVRDTIRALRALPDFSRSPTSNPNQLQSLVALKRCRPKYRDKPLNVRAPGSRLVFPSRNPEVETSPTTKCSLESHKPHTMEAEYTPSSASALGPFGSHLSSGTEMGSYMEMKMDLHRTANEEEEDAFGRVATETGDGCGVAACGAESWEPGKQQGYMMMSPQGSHSSSVLDEYVTMASPPKHNWPAYSSSSSSLQTPFNSSTSDIDSPLHPSHHQTNELTPPHWLETSVQQSETEASQSHGSIRCSTGPQDDARRPPAEPRATSSPVRSVDWLGVMAPFVSFGPVSTRPVQASPTSATGRSSRSASDQSRRCRLSSCLLSCLQAGSS